MTDIKAPLILQSYSLGYASIITGGGGVLTSKETCADNSASEQGAARGKTL
jgi:hypothetical protein